MVRWWSAGMGLMALGAVGSIGCGDAGGGGGTDGGGIADGVTEDGSQGDSDSGGEAGDSSGGEGGAGDSLDPGALGFLEGWPPLAVVGQPFDAALTWQGEASIELVSGPEWLSVDGDRLAGTPTADDLGVSEVVVRLVGQGTHEGDVVDRNGAILVVVSEDADGDGLDNAVELELGTDPEDADSDADGRADAEEVGAPQSPTDTDGDGLIDALESAHFDNDSDGVVDQEDPGESWQLTSMRFWPQVIASDGVDEARAEVRLGRPAPLEQVWLGRSQDPGSPVGAKPLAGLLLDGAAVGAERFELFDDGSHGDRIAGDGIFTRNGLTSNLTGLYVTGQIDEIELDEVTALVGSAEEPRRLWDGYAEGNSLAPAGLMSLGVIEASSVQAPSPLGDGAQFLPYALNVVAPLEAVQVARFLLLGPNPNMRDVAKQAYTALGDDYDILYFVSERPTLGPTAGREETARNSIEGLGQVIFDSGPAYGSPATLQALLALDFATNGPMLHETLHRWGVFFDAQFGFLGTHWGYCGANGQLGGFDPGSLVDNGDGTWTVDRFGAFANGGDGKPYSAWELYLMGLLAAGEIPDLPVLVNASVVSGGDKTTLAADSVKWLSIDEVTAVHGERVPAAGAAPTAFKAAFVVLSQRLLTPAELSWVQARAELFGAPEGDGFLLSFEEATGKRATMTTDLDLP